MFETDNVDKIAVVEEWGLTEHDGYMDYEEC